MTFTWKVQYYQEPAGPWTDISGAVDRIPLELNGHEEAIFLIPNTSTNRTLVSTDKQIRIRLTKNGVTIQQFRGLLFYPKFGDEWINCFVLNECFEKMKRKVHTGNYASTAANTILSAICTSAGVTAGECPTTTVSVRYDKASCYDAGVFLADTLGLDFWATNTTFNIGNRALCKLELKLDEGSGTTGADTSGYGHNGTIASGSWVSGKHKEAVDFTGADTSYLSVADDPDLRVTTEDFTAHIRVNLDTIGQDDTLLCKGLLNTDGWYLAVENTSPTNALKFVSNQSAANQTVKTVQDAISTATWLDIVVVRDGTDVTIYVNGEDKTEASPPSITDPASSTRTLYAMRYDSTGYGVDGKLDEVRFYKGRALEEELAGALYELDAVEYPERGEDRSKVRNHVIIRGVDADGDTIYGEAYVDSNNIIQQGTPPADDWFTKPFTEKKASDIPTLNKLAAKKLAELRSDVVPGFSVPIKIDIAFAMFPGDYATFNKSNLNLTGPFRVWKITKKMPTADVELERPEELLEKRLDDMRKYEDLGIYPATHEQLPDDVITEAEHETAQYHEATWLKRGIQPFNSDLDFVPYPSEEHDRVQWAAGTIKFADGGTLSINAGSTGTLGTGETYIYFLTTSNTLQTTTVYSNTVGDDRALLAIISVSSDSAQEVFIQPFYSKGMNIMADVIAAQAVESLHITTDQIVAKDFRTALNVGQGGGPAGIRFNSSEIAGYSSGTTKEFYLQASDGKGVFGGGSAWLDSSGINLQGLGYMKARNTSGTVVGLVSGAADGLLIEAQTTDGKLYLTTQTGSGADIRMYPQGDVVINNADFLPLYSSVVDIGSSSKKFNAVYCVTLYEGDHSFYERICPDCGKKFKKGQRIHYVVKKCTKNTTTCVPVHAICPKSRKKKPASQSDRNKAREGQNPQRSRRAH